MLVRKVDISTLCEGADMHRDREGKTYVHIFKTADEHAPQTTEASQVSLESEGPDAEVISVPWKLSSAFCLVGLPDACL